MPLHDWTRVEAEIFHDFHLAWNAGLQKNLNCSGLLVDSYAIIEQHSGRSLKDILLGITNEPARWLKQPTDNRSILLAATSPPEGAAQILESSVSALRRTLAIRDNGTHRVIALLEIVSPANKDRGEHVEEFAIKMITALERGVHVLVVDLFPPGVYDPNGIHGEIRQRLVPLDDSFELSRDEPQTSVSYVAGSPTRVYLNQMSVGGAIPEMPLFLSRERYVNAPLEATYNAAYQGMPKSWRDVLEGRID